MPNVLSPRDLVFRPDNMDETVPHLRERIPIYYSCIIKCGTINTSAVRNLEVIPTAPCVILMYIIKRNKVLLNIEDTNCKKFYVHVLISTALPGFQH